VKLARRRLAWVTMAWVKLVRRRLAWLAVQGMEVGKKTGADEHLHHGTCFI
jgi:urease accessory protein UreE